jgi:hypothetical protein
MDKLQGIVKGFNTVQYNGKLINCWINKVDDHRVRQPLDLFQYMDEVIEIEGKLKNDLWEAKFIKKFNKANEAKSLNDLLRIRATNIRDLNEKVKDNNGTALGYKWTNKRNTKHPCIMIFVQKKKICELVPKSQRAPKILIGPNGVWCLTDVISWKERKVSALKLSNKNKDVVKKLHSGKTGLIGGIKLAYKKKKGNSVEVKDCGTAGIVVERKDGKKGFLTNKHVAGKPGREIYHHGCSGDAIGYTSSLPLPFEDINFKDWYNINSNEKNTKVTCDYAFVEFYKKTKKNENSINHGLFEIGNIGSVMEIDLQKMDIIGQKVISIGSKSGIQRGTIVAYSYRWHHEPETKIGDKTLEEYNIYTDLLIRGEQGEHFSSKGDSGKVIVSDDDEHLPIGLLWGGTVKDILIDKKKKQYNWSYAINLGKILNHSKLSIYK